MQNNNSTLARHGLLAEDVFKDFNGGVSNAAALVKGLIERNGLKDFSNVPDHELIAMLKETSRGIQSPGPGMLIDPVQGDLPLTDFDPYIRGIVRWLNELGIYTFGSCDGHGRTPAMILLKKFPNAKQLEVLKTAALEEIDFRCEGKRVSLRYPEDKQELLLNMAENLYRLWNNPGYLTDLQAMKFKSFLIEMLSIPGSSGNERAITLRLRNKLLRLLDHTYIDKKGNLLGFIELGQGPTILLSSHMDTVEEIETGREIMVNGTMLSSSKGILGADDRAGIAAIIEILRRLPKTNFRGTIKVAFTVEEEIGCLGSRGIDRDFLEDVQAAIVIDRRGNRDIVTSNRGFPFCPEEFGFIMEKAGKFAGMDDWKAVPGGISDAKVFSSFGIPSVNLSVGYQHEHTDLETLDYRATFETVLLVESFFHHILGEKNENITLSI
ncbi:M20/M25/M40 family metallo-hydrolase [Bacillus sp. T33-2]|uniref:M20/M25/M40 family metallo-hydrolase n=1 Tax=Bacillus sp. T33-2 TaxID=2054168 RepID=UPI000C77201B|nr:M20/M25/M40 family metallo-hydrolase [Bacillus sp. T33-2]PLR98529.1 peptidase M20 [Bacillus sp. T33-2]